MKEGNRKLRESTGALEGVLGKDAATLLSKSTPIGK
jgi:hypothetical protein